MSGSPDLPIISEAMFHIQAWKLLCLMPCTSSKPRPPGSRPTQKWLPTQIYWEQWASFNSSILLTKILTSWDIKGLAQRNQPDSRRLISKFWWVCCFYIERRSFAQETFLNLWLHDFYKVEKKRFFLKNDHDELMNGFRYEEKIIYIFTCEMNTMYKEIQIISPVYKKGGNFILGDLLMSL